MHKQYVFFLNILHLQVSVTLEHLQGAYVTEYSNLIVLAFVQDVVNVYVSRSKQSCSILATAVTNVKKSCCDVQNDLCDIKCTARWLSNDCWFFL
jgi:hypothetical protein